MKMFNNVFLITILLLSCLQDSKAFDNRSLIELIEEPPAICFVRYTLENNIELYWDSTVADEFEEIFIYRATYINNEFDLIGSISETANGYFLDENVSLYTSTYYYKLKALDIEGNKTEFSDAQGAIYSRGGRTTMEGFDFTWTPYHGLDFDNYKIFKGTSPDDLRLIADVPKDSLRFIDPDPSDTDIYYQIALDNEIDCNTAEGVLTNQVHSNIITNFDGASFFLVQNDDSVCTQCSEIDRVESCYSDEGTSCYFRFTLNFNREILGNNVTAKVLKNETVNDKFDFVLEVVPFGDLPNMDVDSTFTFIAISGLFFDLRYPDKSDRLDLQIEFSVDSMPDYPRDTFNMVRTYCVPDRLEDVVQISQEVICLGDNVAIPIDPKFDDFSWIIDGSHVNVVNGLIPASDDMLLEVSTDLGCVFTYRVDLNFLTLPAPSPCFVRSTPDAANEIYWDIQDNGLTEEVLVYRETSVLDQFDLIARKPAAQEGIFIDDGVNANSRSFRYKLSAIDTCGNETDLGIAHKTMHLIVSRDIQDNVSLEWEDYQGVDFSSYFVFRGTSPEQMSFLTQLPSSINSFTDFNPEGDAIFYQIVVAEQVDCTPQKNLDLFSIQSNIAEIVVSNIFDDEFSNTSFYPNPAENKIWIKSNDQIAEYELINTQGQIVERAALDERRSVDVSKFSAGIYFLKCEDKRGKTLHIEKLLIN